MITARCETCGKRISRQTIIEWDAAYQQHLDTDCIRASVEEKPDPDDEDEA